LELIPFFSDWFDVYSCFRPITPLKNAWILRHHTLKNAAAVAVLYATCITQDSQNLLGIYPAI